MGVAASGLAADIRISGGRHVTQDWSAAQVWEIVARHPDWFAGVGDSGQLTWVGQGESYSVWRVGDPGALGGPGADDAGEQGGALILRLARRPTGELPVPAVEEFTGLRLAPAGLGPRVIGMGAIGLEAIGRGAIGMEAIGLGERAGSDDAEHSYPYLVQSFVLGVVLPAAQWTDAMRAELAASFARLHERQWPCPGPVTAAGAPSGPASRSDSAQVGIDLPAEIEGIVAHWSPRLDSRARAVWEPFVAPMRAYARELAAEFAALASFSQLHGDPALTNILVAQGTPRLIDWEWTQIGDPARDLAFVGGQVHAHPWYGPLTDRQITGLLTAYREAGGRGDLDALRRRRDLWLALEGFAVLAYLLWVAGDPRQTPAAHHAESIRSLTATLGPALAPCGRSPG